jgi:Holliday junction resolvase
MQRNKGAAGEREFFKLLSASLGITVKRKLGQAREGGNDGDCGPLVIEVKRYRRFAVARHLEQAQRAAGDAGKLPMVALREDGGQWMVLMYAEHFFQLTEGGGLWQRKNCQ